MPIEIIVPRLGWSMEEGAFVAWLKKDGELVKAGEPLFSIEGDKAVQEIESIDSGILRIAADGPKAGDSIRVGQLLGQLLSANETAPMPVPPKASAVAAKPTTTTPTIAIGRPSTVPAASQSPSTPTRVLSISPRAVRAAAEHGIDWTTVTGTGRTGRIRERDILDAASSRTAPRSGTQQQAAGDTTPTVLVTGGCGFIGTWVLRELLERGLNAVVLDAGERPARWRRVIGDACEKIPLVRGSLLDRSLVTNLFEQQRITHVIHLAALLTPACQNNPWEGCQVNVLGSVALLEELRKRAGGIRGFSYASSVAVFGDEPDHASGDAHATLPLTLYGAFKKSVELITEQYWRHFQIASVGIRPQVAYGPEREVGLTAGPSLAARAAARGEEFCISYTGRIGYDYVEDVARAFVRGALETPPGAHVVDLQGETADIGEVIGAIASAAPGDASRLSASGPPVPAHAPPKPRSISTLFPDWQTTSLAQGMRRTIDYYREHR